VSENVVPYTLVYQPRRLKLRAQVIPPKTPPDHGSIGEEQRVYLNFIRSLDDFIR
jgi:hypothetical protein